MLTPPVLLPSLTSIVIIAPLARDAIVKKMKLVHIFQERVFGFMIGNGVEEPRKKEKVGRISSRMEW